MNMFGQVLAMWGCIPEITKDCIDVTNAGGTYLGVIIGAIIGSIISWWIYNRQKKISIKQDDLLFHISDLEENNELILRRIEYLEKKNEKLLENVLILEEKINFLLAKNK